MVHDILALIGCSIIYHYMIGWHRIYQYIIRWHRIYQYMPWDSI